MRCERGLSIRHYNAAPPLHWRTLLILFHFLLKAAGPEGAYTAV